MNIRTLTVFTLVFAFAATPLLAEEREGRQDRGGMIERRDARIERVDNRMDKLEDRMERGEKQGEKRGWGKKGNASSTIDATCAKAAIDVRSSAILTAFNTHNTTISALIASSTIGEKAAFDLATNGERQKALRAVRQALKMGRMQARKTMMEAEKTAFTTFKTSMKACGANGNDVEKGEPLVN